MSVLPRPRTAAARALAAPATVAAIVVAGLLLSACATMPPERCAEVSWQQQGIEDGRAGFGPTRLARHREACAGIGVVPDQAAWEQGHALGLLDYCQLPNALQQGLARHAYEGVCADPRFRQLYGAARRLADERQKVVDLDHQIDWRERELLTNPKLTEQRRAELTAEARSLHRERERAIDERADATRALERVRDQVGL